ncbi:YbaN family protein [Candidatus Nitrospira allomarina]|uniref:YbaN family protein n=1 Tax=Candidatus Nitrospira allomarina TaxID=3020900 RepID=A0AA96GA94_9BACT|nr:YbaN family protein [Candidatus Nitrospira allomarina]
MPAWPVRLILLVIGWVSLALGILGLFFPLLPTMPFVLLAASCFSKSSPRINSWLLSQPLLGPMIQNWHHEGSINQNTKVTATVFMLGLFGCSLLIFHFSAFLTIFLVCIGSGVLLFIWTRPLPSGHLNQFRNRPTDTGENLVGPG